MCDITLFNKKFALIKWICKMKIICILILASICLLSINLMSVPYKAPPYNKIVDNIMSRASKRLVKKHSMRLIGIHEGMMGCVKMMGFRFQVYRPLSKDEARAMVVDSIQDFLADINQDEKIRQYLEVYPFDLNHVDMMIFIDTPDYGTYYYPNLCVVTASRGNIRYSTNDPEKKYSYKTEETESFEDAVKILKGN